jgi:hypothetical protein
MAAKRETRAPRFAICVATDDPDLLTPRMVYQVLPDDSAAKSEYLRVIDNEGEDYLYPAAYFVLVNLPQTARRALTHSERPASHGARRRTPGRAAPRRRRPLEPV